MQICSLNGCNSAQINKNRYQSQQNFTARREVEVVEDVMNKAKTHPKTQQILQSLNLNDINGRLNEIGTSVIAAVKKSFYSDSTYKGINTLGNNEMFQILKKNTKGEQVLATVKVVPADSEIKGMVQYKDFETHQVKTLELDDSFNLAVKTPEFR